MEREICLKQKQKQKTVTNIHDIYNSNKSKSSKIEVNNNEYYILQQKILNLTEMVHMKIGGQNQYR